MTTTPTIWKAKFTANNSLNGNEFGAQSIGLSNGNILVVWDDAVVGTGAGRDIVGQMFHADGTKIGSSFQVNDTFENQNETAPKIVALPDGGFVVAYVSYNDFIGDFIVVERFNAAGGEVAYHLITEDLGSLNELHFCEITVDNNGNYIVAFDRWTGEGYDVRATVYSYVSNNPLPEYDAAQNESADSDHLGNIATFADGNIITISTEPDGSGVEYHQGVEYKITESGTGNVVGSPVAVAGAEFYEAYATDVAVLTGGQFVVLYEYDTVYASHFALRIGSGDAPGSALGPEIIVGVPQALADQDEASVVALKDGGFLIVWADSGTVADALYATRYNAAGTIIGTQNFVIATGLADPGNKSILGHLQLTSDGRVLVPFRNSDGDISEVILDPRETTIEGTESSEELTTQTGDSSVFAHGGDDTIYGLGGDDYLDGGAGTDTLIGGGGDDTYNLYDLHKLDPMLNIFVYDTVVESANGGNDTVQVTHVPSSSTTNYTLGPNVENGVVIGSDAFNLTGNTLANRLTGSDGVNVLTGGDGNDVLNGLGGADTMTGGMGYDTYYVDNAGDVVNENANEGTDEIKASISYSLAALGNIENLTLTGSANINATGNSGSNFILGNSGNNTLDGGAGNDTMYGGAGNDTYVVDNATDATVEFAGGGTDTVNVSFNYTLIANVENLVLTGSADLQGYGNAVANTLTGNSGNNLLNGLAGADTMFGGAGNDVYFADNAGDAALENASEGNDAVFSTANFTLSTNVESLILQGAADLQGYGNSLANTIYGNTGNNLLNGNGGVDLMAGGAGNDVYFADDSSDAAFEAANEGNDTVFASASYGLAADVENLILQGSADLQGYGNGGANVLNGNTGSNLLNGGGGIDLMVGGAGNDIYYADDPSDSCFEVVNQGNDAVFATCSYGLAADVESLILQGSGDFQAYGSSQANTIYGNSGSNLINGGAGADTMVGGAGNDVYFVDNAGDGILENANEGNDAVFASVNYTLTANVEGLVQQGAGNISGTGNTLANVISGNAGNNTLDGGAGADTLTGNAGNDTFVFNVGQVAGDTVVDFAGNGAAAGDALQFIGYGGATFTNIDATHWQVNYNGGSSHDIITFLNGAPIDATDLSFI